VRTASRRARRLGGLLLLAATVWWAFMRRRANAVRWMEPPPIPPTGVPAAGEPAGVPAEPGAPSELPDDVLATDAGLTELPEPAADEGPADTVDETRVAELLAESADADVVVVDETTYEQAIAEAAPEPAAPPVPSGADAGEEPAERELGATGVEEPTVSIRPEADEDSDRGIPMPTFSEAPTMELPAVSDDLRAVRGIGPSMERTLHSLGIVSYRQLALLDGAELERVRAELTEFRNRIEREDWVGQARALHREKYGRDPS
jgi:predicted flap endonuclease-1-like 5' DNA nuclease